MQRKIKILLTISGIPKLFQGLKSDLANLSPYLTGLYLLREKISNKRNSFIIRVGYSCCISFFCLRLVHLHTCVAGLSKCVGLATSMTAAGQHFVNTVCLCGFDPGTSSVPFFSLFPCPHHNWDDYEHCRNIFVQQMTWDLQRDICKRW